MEEERTAFEKEFGIDLSDKNLDVSKGIDISLKVEEEGRAFYATNARKIQNMEIKRFIEFLAGEEDKPPGEALGAADLCLEAGGEVAGVGESGHLVSIPQGRRFFVGHGAAHRPADVPRKDREV